MSEENVVELPERFVRYMKAKQDEGDPEALWLSRLRVLYGDVEPPARILAMDDRLRQIVGPDVLVARALKGRVGWQVGGAFLDLADVAILSDVEIRSQVADMAARERTLARARAM